MPSLDSAMDCSIMGFHDALSMANDAIRMIDAAFDLRSLIYQHFIKVMECLFSAFPI